MAKRETAAQRSQRDKRVTPQSIAAGKKNLEKGRESTKRRRAAAKGADFPTAGERWAQLLDGSLSVRELDDQEIQHMRVRNADGGFAGKARALPSHLAQQFRAEAIRRAKDKITSAIPIAAKTLVEIINDPEAKHSDRIKCLQIILDRGMGKTPDVIRVEGDAKWDQVLREVDLDRLLADDGGADESQDADA